MVLLLWLFLINESYVRNQLNKKEMQEQKGTADAERQKEYVSESFLTEDYKIKVLLMDSGYHTYFHPEVSLQCAGKEYFFTEADDFPETFTAEFSSPEGVLVSSIQRECGNPVYKGKILVRKESEGFLLINEVSLEDYLKAVVPSEMPSTYEKQALMAQAVCARTYAYKQMENGSLKSYGADVDDSVRFQVYQNISPQKETTEAVEATKGEVLTYAGELIEAFYFSTSSGKTSTDEVWGSEQSLPYLKSVACTFDSEEYWSEWKVCMPWARIQERIVELFEDKTDFVSMEIIKKAQNGAVTELQIITEEEVYSVKQEYEIREFLSPQGCFITGKDGKQYAGGELLPSSCFTFEIIEGKEVIFTGKGYGHGVGMSQNGANEMARRGYEYQEILHYFFHNVTIENR